LINRKGVHIASKWAKTIAIRRDPAVARYVPETRRMTERTLGQMLNRYGMVYVKPVAGTFGQGVMRVERTSGSPLPYSSHAGTNKRRFASLGALYRHIGRTKRRRPYLVQRGIHLLRTNGRRFDVRVMAQKNPAGAWESTGIIARVAGRGKVVTNYHNGGRPVAVGALLRPKLGARLAAHTEARLRSLGLRSAKTLARAYPRINMVGADIGLDRQLRPWIIELNTSPDPYLFRHLKDKSTHRKVMRYARLLGRIPSARGGTARGGRRQAAATSSRGRLARRKR